MDAAVIKFKASGQQLSVVSTNLFAANTVSYIRAEFELGYNWDGWDSVRAVWATDFAKIATVLDSDGACTIPWEVLKRTATLYVNLVGSISDGDELTDRLTTYKVKALDVNGCTNVDGDNTQPLTPSQFEQFVAVVHDDAEAAADARDEARGYASDAEGYKDESVGAAADAKDYRDAAKGYADDAEDYKDQAKGYADEAEADAEEIRSMTATATTLPEGSSATASYSNGVLSLGIPKGDTGATGATGNGIASAVLNADYTLTLNFTDGTHYTTPPIRGAQGVQGETGNGIDRIELTDTTGAVKTYTIYFTDGSTYDFEVTDGEVTLAELASVLPTDTASGAIASFPDGSNLFDYLSCIVNIEPVQAGSGTPSPDNVRPITGWTGCEVDVVGKNLFDKGATDTDNGFVAGRYVGATGVEAVSANFNISEFLPIKANEQYTLSGLSGGVPAICFYDKTKAYISGVNYGGSSSISFTTPNDAKYYRLSIPIANVNIVQLEVGSTASAFEPYNPNSAVYNITWQTEAGTVYGGTVDLVSGVLTVDRVSASLGIETWVNVTGYTDVFRCQFNNKAPTDFINYICSHYPSVNASTLVANMPDKCCKGNSTYGNYFYIKDSAYDGATGEDFKTAMNGVQLVYELATPQTYELDPVQVACLLGRNNVWADCGDIEEVKYKADVQLWVEKMLNA